MTLEAYRYDGKGTVTTKFTDYPVCGYEFADNEFRADHFYEENDPEDLGLSPLGETPEEYQEPLFEPVENLPVPPEAEAPAPHRARNDRRGMTPTVLLGSR